MFSELGLASVLKYNMIYLARCCVKKCESMTYLPVYFPLNASNVEEHVHPREVGRRGEGCEVLLVLNIYGGPALYCHVEHGNVVVHHHNVGNCASVGVRQIAVASLDTPHINGGI